jgi:hypothetical protein
VIRGSSTPSGEKLIESAQDRGGALDRLARLMTSKTDDLQDAGKDVGALVQRGLSIGRSRASGGAPTVEQPTAPGVIAKPAARPHIEATDAVGQLVVVAAATWLGAQRVGRKVRTELKRRRAADGQ